MRLTHSGPSRSPSAPTNNQPSNPDLKLIGGVKTMLLSSRDHSLQQAARVLRDTNPRAFDEIAKSVHRAGADEQTTRAAGTLMRVMNRHKYPIKSAGQVDALLGHLSNPAVRKGIDQDPHAFLAVWAFESVKADPAWADILKRNTDTATSEVCRSMARMGFTKPEVAAAGRALLEVTGKYDVFIHAQEQAAPLVRALTTEIYRKGISSLPEHRVRTAVEALQAPGVAKIAAGAGAMAVGQLALQNPHALETIGRTLGRDPKDTVVAAVRRVAHVAVAHPAIGRALAVKNESGVLNAQQSVANMRAVDAIEKAVDRNVGPEQREGLKKVIFGVAEARLSRDPAALTALASNVGRLSRLYPKTVQVIADSMRHGMSPMDARLYLDGAMNSPVIAQQLAAQKNGQLLMRGGIDDTDRHVMRTFSRMGPEAEVCRDRALVARFIRAIDQQPKPGITSFLLRRKEPAPALALLEDTRFLRLLQHDKATANAALTLAENLNSRKVSMADLDRTLDAMMKNKNLVGIINTRPQHVRKFVGEKFLELSPLLNKPTVEALLKDRRKIDSLAEAAHKIAAVDRYLPGDDLKRAMLLNPHALKHVAQEADRAERKGDIALGRIQHNAVNLIEAMRLDDDIAAACNAPGRKAAKRIQAALRMPPERSTMLFGAFAASEALRANPNLALRDIPYGIKGDFEAGLRLQMDKSEDGRIAYREAVHLRAEAVKSVFGPMNSMFRYFDESTWTTVERANKISPPAAARLLRDHPGAITALSRAPIDDRALSRLLEGAMRSEDLARALRGAKPDYVTHVADCLARGKRWQMKVTERF